MSILDIDDQVKNNDIIILDWLDKNLDIVNGVIELVDGEIPVVNINRHGRDQAEVYLKSDVQEFPNIFKFGKIYGGFHCRRGLIKSLKGAPEVVYGRFDCIQCDYLTDLEGAPQYVDEDFICINCANLEEINLSFKRVGHDFMCYQCGKLKNINIDNFKDSIKGNFDCHDCISLENLPTFPEHHSGYIDLDGCTSIKNEEFIKLPDIIEGNLYMGGIKLNAEKANSSKIKHIKEDERDYAIPIINSVLLIKDHYDNVIKIIKSNGDIYN